MLQVRALVPDADAATIAHELEALPGVHRVISGGHTHDGDTVLYADVTPSAADQALDHLVQRVPPEAISLVRLESAHPIEQRAHHRWVGGDASEPAWAEVIDVARADAQLLTRYGALMPAAGAIAGVGVATKNVILIIGAMAISPDLLPLSATCVGLVAKRPRLVGRGLSTLTLGLLTATITALLAAFILEAFDLYSGDLGSGGLGTLTTTDASTILVALAAGVAGMLAFETRSATAVGVAISVTTIPAAAYLGVAAASNQGSDALGALGVLATNLACVLAAGTLTLAVQRAARHRRREPEQR